MEQTAARLLETLSSIQCLDERNREEGDGEAPAKILVDYSMERLRKQKMLCGQLQVLRLMLEFLQQADTASWDETSPKILSLEVEEAKKNWKKLKAEYQERVKEVQGILPQLLQRVQLLHQKKRDLEESLKRYQSRVSRAQHMERDNLTTSREKVVTDVLLENKTKQKLQELHGQVENQQMVVKKCHDQIQKLEEEMQRLEESATSWIQTVSRDSTLCNLLQTLHGVSLVSVGDKEIVLDLDVGDKGETPPLRVTLHWTSQGNLNVESDVPLPSLPQELLDGGRISCDTCHPRATELVPEPDTSSEGTRRTAEETIPLNGFRVSNEIPALLKRHSVDRHESPADSFTAVSRRNQTSNARNGQVQLVTLKRAQAGTDPNTCKPPTANPSLSDWLEYLHTSPHTSQ